MNEARSRATHRPELLVGTICLLTSVLTPATALGQHRGGQRFTPASSEDGIFELEGADRRPLYLPYVGLWFHWGWSPVTVLDASGEQMGARSTPAASWSGAGRPAAPRLARRRAGRGSAWACC